MLNLVMLNAYELGDAVGKFLTGFFLATMAVMIIFIMYRYLGNKKT